VIQLIVVTLATTMPALAFAARFVMLALEHSGPSP
jgi:hypothetical protein